jgi:hypothetical protein
MVSMLASNLLDGGCEYKIGICYFSEKHAALSLSSNNKDWSTLNHDNVFKWSDISTCCCKKIQLPGKHFDLIESRHYHHLIESLTKDRSLNNFV